MRERLDDSRMIRSASSSMVISKAAPTLITCAPFVSVGGQRGGSGARGVAHVREAARLGAIGVHHQRLASEGTADERGHHRPNAILGEARAVGVEVAQHADR